MLASTQAGAHVDPWFVSFGLTALVIVVGRNRARAKVQAESGVGSMDRSITLYLVLGLSAGRSPSSSTPG